MDKTVTVYRMELPSLFKVILYGIILGIIQMPLVLILPGGYIFMPVTYGSIPFDMICFICGVIAKRNDWLSQLSHIKWKNKVIVWLLMILCFLIACATFIYLYWIDIGAGFQMAKKNESPTNCENDTFDINWQWIIGILGTFVFGGVSGMIIMVGMLQFAQTYCNATNAFTKFLSQSAYTVYLIHPFIITPIIWSYQELMHFWKGTDFMFCHNESLSKTHLENDALVWLGWIYTVVLSLIIVWPLAWGMRRLPGLNQIL
eukprot:192041_1